MTQSETPFAMNTPCVPGAFSFLGRDRLKRTLLVKMSSYVGSRMSPGMVELVRYEHVNTENHSNILLREGPFTLVS